MTSLSRVIHYYPRFLDHRSGVTESIAAWAEIAAAEVPVEVWAAGSIGERRHRDADRLRELGVPLRQVPHVGRSSRTYLLQWWRAHLRPGDVVYVHEGWVPANVLMTWLARRAGARVVAMPHGVYAPQVVEAGRDVFGVRARLERSTLRRVDAVHLFFASEGAEVSAVAGAPVSAGVFSNPAPDIADADAWVGGGDYFVWIGRFVVGHKGLDLLLRGWSELAHPRPRLVLAGPDYLGGKAEVAGLVRTLGLEDSVTLRDSVTGQDKHELMTRARGYIHSSRWDACSMMLLEFMARGTPSLINSTVHAASPYEAAGAALSFTDAGDFPARIRALEESPGLGDRAAAYMRAEVSAQALRPGYLAWLESVAAGTHDAQDARAGGPPDQQLGLLGSVSPSTRPARETSMKQHIRRVARNIPLARAANNLRVRRDQQIIDALPAYAPNSAGHAEVRSAMALHAATQSVEFLAQLVDQLGAPELTLTDPAGFAARGTGATTADRLDELLRRHGSDKSTDHDYHHVYARILETAPPGAGIAEVGLGTNNESIVSTMGRFGHPGASLRAFRDYLPESEVIGADIDRDILFTEERITTFWVDQTSDESVRAFEAQLPEDLHLLIDDGLHSPNANLQILMLGLRSVPVGGWVVIEDIIPAAQDFWRVVAALLPTHFESTLVRAKGGDMFVVQRTA